MRSIRWSLIVYFLTLVGVALGAVSWLVYRTTAQTLQDKEASTAQLIEAQFRDQCDEARAVLDRGLLAQARGLARKASSTSSYYEILYPLGAISAPLSPQGYLNIPVWGAEGFYRELALQLHFSRPAEVVLRGAEDHPPHPGEATVYFQTFHARGQPIQRSESLGDHVLTLDPGLYKSDFFQVHFDDVQLPAGAKLRRVTLKVPWPRFIASTTFAWPADMLRPTKGGFPLRPGVMPRPGFSIFLQYAVDTAPNQKQVAAWQAERDGRLAQLADETDQTLANLRLRLLWIGLATFAGFVIGGLTLVWIGLKPLARLSEAVSQVSSKDFHLNVDVNHLPRELQPIASRLAETLEQLQEAFAREKQAAADISHELRTPVATLLAIVDVGLRKQRSATEYREMLEDCQATAQHMAVLVERLMSLARLDAGADALRLKAIDVSELAFQCADLVRPLAEGKGLRLDVHAPEAISMLADPDKLLEILNNLLHNAIEYNRPEGTIDLRVEASARDVVFEVSDTGIGMAPQVKEQIFQRFFRADPSRHSEGPHVGLGLAIVKSFVELMGGTIEVASSSAGSTFRVRLPRTIPESVAEHRQAITAAPSVALSR